MRLSNALPAVCSAIGGRKFSELARVSLRNRTGPANGANVYFNFRLSACPTLKQRTVARRETVAKEGQARLKSGLDFGDALVLVSCVKSKLPLAAPARDIYTSAWFRKARDIVEASGARWFVLSSRYGLVAPDAIIAPYDYTLNTLGVAERRSWAADVFDQLLPELTYRRRVVMFAGMRYREFLIEPLLRQGIEVDVPMANLRRGEQLEWLSEH